MPDNRSSHAPRIAIVGAGIGGLCLAACLRRIGVRADVFEQAPRFARIGAGIMLAPNAVNILNAIGVREHLEPTSVTLTTLQNRAWDSGEPMFDLELGAAAEQRYGAPFLLAHRGDLHAALLRVVPPEAIHPGRELVGICPLDDRVELRFADGSAGSFDAVIGADGVHSVVRRSLFTTSPPSFTGRIAYRAVFDSALLADRGLAPEVGPSTKWWGPDRHIVIYYVSGGAEVYFTTSVPDDTWTTESWSAEGSMDELRAEFEGFHPQVQAVLAACPRVNKWALYDRDPLPGWSTGRVALLGDAAHPMTPFMAQGAATSMEDAAVLSRCLGEAGPENFATAFAWYESVRQQRTARIQAISRSNTWLRERTDPSEVYGYDAWSVPFGDSAGLESSLT
ncbi:FAD-dependent monooxygenase [Rhizomonospora bruguierae]|uniref:FAD-dependent monooxygenase n=1 Tax=Rhizomonospora bruguierae TaxID=1581705 RepID=UPI001BD054CE|nr:FAD-dependent monooxygenase [Micromonospora sp. NBRC 107566]